MASLPIGLETYVSVMLVGEVAAAKLLIPGPGKVRKIDVEEELFVLEAAAAEAAAEAVQDAVLGNRRHVQLAQSPGIDSQFREPFT